MAGWKNPLPRVRDTDTMWMRTIFQSLERWSSGNSALPYWWAAGTWQQTPMATNALQTVALTQNRTYATGVYLPDGGAINNVSVEVTSAGGTGSVFRFGLYNDDDGKPGALLFDAGTVSATSTGFKQVAVSWRFLQPGWYWIATVPQGGTAPTVRQATNPLTGLGPYRTTTISNTPDSWAVYGAAATGALPASYGAVTAAVNGPLVLFRAA